MRMTTMLMRMRAMTVSRTRRWDGMAARRAASGRTRDGGEMWGSGEARACKAGRWSADVCSSCGRAKMQGQGCDEINAAILREEQGFVIQELETSMTLRV